MNNSLKFKGLLETNLVFTSVLSFHGCKLVDKQTFFHSTLHFPRFLVMLYKFDLKIM